MFGSIGAPEMAIVLVFILPFVVLWKVAAWRNMSRGYALWAILGYVGLIIGILLMLAKRPRPMPSEPTGEPSAEGSTKRPVL